MYSMLKAIRFRSKWWGFEGNKIKLSRRAVIRDLKQ